ncbi:MAG: helix-turn-helix domain-containing protein [Candidatus Cloacimonadaceae bacterium]|nr:helix-turn-helix domain-containing protein [Candidatus Cloacimonadaceae bacterium]
MKTKLETSSNSYVPTQPERISNAFGIPQYKPEDIPKPPDPNTPRGQIFIAATQLFSQFGYKETTTRAIARLAGVKQVMIHYYYGSKKSCMRLS